MVELRESTLDTVSIGNVNIERSAALAPMASVADKAYRLMCKHFGAAYLVSEMISAKGLVYGDKKTAVLCQIEQEEHPMALQLFGEDSYYVGKAAEMLAKYKPDIIDINMGCPVPKIVGNGSGSAIMRTPRLAYEIAKAAVENASCPVTAKIRAGWNSESVNAVEVAKYLEEAGVSAIAVHGRTRDQFYSGTADREIIRKVKEAVSCPVIGNGDVVSAEDCKAMYEQTGCDLVMSGRGSYGRPWIFREVKHYLETGKLLPEPSVEEKMRVMLEHAELLCRFKGERQGIKEMRHNVAWYIKGMPGAAKIRGASGEQNTLDDLRAIAEKLVEAAER